MTRLDKMVDATIIYNADGSGTLTAPDGSVFDFPSGVPPAVLATIVLACFKKKTDPEEAADEMERLREALEEALRHPAEPLQ